MRLNLGCGIDIKEGWINADKAKLKGVDSVFDMSKKFPFKNNTVDEIYSRHSLEHSKDVMFTLEEICRVCKPNARVKIITPHASAPIGRGNLDHHADFTYKTFDKFEPTHKRNYYTKTSFNIVKVEFTKTIYGFTLGFANKHPEFYELHLDRYFPIVEITYILEVNKK